MNCIDAYYSSKNAKLRVDKTCLCAYTAESVVGGSNG